MHIRLDVLSRYTDLPADPAATRVLLDEVGLEVKRIDPAAPGVPVTLELLANRGDHHAYVGLAREVRGRTGGPLRVPDGLPLTPGDGPVPVRVEDPDALIYTVTRLRRTGDGPLDADALSLLESCGLQPVHPVVDATNVVNLELGQPTHAFDAAKVVGAITLRASRDGERAWPLFAPEPIALPAGLLVVADDEKVLAIAGVIGCEDSKTTDATTEVLLESAAFDPVRVRKGARALSIHTDSSARFERGSDLSMPVVGAGRVAALLAGAGWSVDGTTGVHGAGRPEARTVRFDPDLCRSFLAIDASDAELVERLERYGFRIGPETRVDPVSGAPRSEALTVLVPPHRVWDVEHPADLYEEIARSIGYDATPIGLPPVDMGSLPSDAEVLRDTLAEVLVGQGFFEVITDGFHGRGLHEALGVADDHPLSAYVETANALDRAYSLLKNNALAQALDGVALNQRMKHDQIKAFELTRTFHPDAAAPNGVCTERDVLWALAAGTARPASWVEAPPAADAVFLKGVLAELALAAGLPLVLGPADPTAPLHDVLHPHRQAAVLLHGRRVGILGEVHPRVLDAMKLKRVRPVYLELELAPLEAATPERTAYEEPPRVPPVVRNLAFTLPVGPDGVRVGEVIAAVEAGAPDWLGGVEAVDRFVHEEDGRTVHTWTLALSWRNDAGDRTADELNGATEDRIAAVQAALGHRGVALRG